MESQGNVSRLAKLQVGCNVAKKRINDDELKHDQKKKATTIITTTTTDILRRVHNSCYNTFNFVLILKKSKYGRASF